MTPLLFTLQVHGSSPNFLLFFLLHNCTEKVERESSTQLSMKGPGGGGEEGEEKQNQDHVFINPCQPNESLKWLYKSEPPFLTVSGLLTP